MTKKILSAILFLALATLAVLTAVAAVRSVPVEMEIERGPGASVSTSPPVAESGLIRDWGIQPYKRFEQKEAGGELELASWSAATVPASRRVIEVVDTIKPTDWNVAKAVNWLDRYTASDMRLVARCSGKAYRCITVRAGKVAGAPVGWSSGSTITIDLAKANGPMRYRYKQAANRHYLLVHELGHQHGLDHTGRLAKNVMNPYVNRYRLALTSGQRSVLRTR